jgi:hypothetical protein
VVAGRVAGGLDTACPVVVATVLGFVVTGFGVLAGTLLTVVAAVAPLFR